MRIALIAAGFAALTLAACNSPEDQAAEQQADALENQAEAVREAAPDGAAGQSADAQADALDKQADQVEQQAGDADGGATTGNTPTTQPAPSN